MKPQKGKLVVGLGILCCGRVECKVETSLISLGTKDKIIQILKDSGWRETPEFGWICSHCDTPDEALLRF